MARKRKEKSGEKKKPFPFFRPTSVGPTKEFPSATYIYLSPLACLLPRLQSLFSPRGIEAKPTPFSSSFLSLPCLLVRLLGFDPTDWAFSATHVLFSGL